MVRKQYGTTWWGKKWLDALTGIDYANRIPRGLSYARNNRVLDVQINSAQGKIMAVVEGSHYSSYTIKLGFPRVAADKKKAFLDAALADISIVTHLTARELDPKLFALAKEHGIMLFPRKWSDLKMSCTCPDWAVPCKHIAAVIYTLCELIDANPFLIFELIGIDLTAELKSRNIFEDISEEVSVTSMDELYRQALIRPQTLTAIAAQHDFELNLAPVSAQDAKVLYLAPDLHCYSSEQVPFAEEERHTAHEREKLTQKRKATEKAILELEHRIKKDKRYVAQQEPNLSTYRRDLKKLKSARARNKFERISMLEEQISAITRVQSSLEQAQSELKALKAKLPEYEAKLNELKGKQVPGASADSALATELLLGYNPEALKAQLMAKEQAQAVASEESALSATALSELDAIDSGDDVVPDDTKEVVAPAPTQKKRGSKPKVKPDEVEPASEGTGIAPYALAAKLNGLKSELQDSVAKLEGQDHLSPEEQQTLRLNKDELEQVKLRLKSLQQALTALALKPHDSLDVRRYSGNIAALERLSFEPIPDIGDSIRNMFAENAPGFAFGNLRNRVFHTVEFAAKLATKQLKDTSDRDMVRFDFDGSMTTYEPGPNWATRGKEPEDGNSATSEHDANAQLATTADKAKARAQERKLSSKRVMLFSQVAQPWSHSYYFSGLPLSEHGFFAHPPLFFLGEDSQMELGVPMHVVTTDRFGAPQPNSLSIFPPKQQVSYYHFAGLYQMFSGFIKNTNVLLKERAEVQILYYLWYIATELVKARAIMPQLVVSEKGGLVCRWIPATASDEVRALVTKVGLALQGYEHFLFYRRDRQYYLDPTFLGELALAPFIQSYISWGFALDPKGLTAQNNIPELEVLLLGQGVALDDEHIDAQGLRMRLESWVAPLTHGLGTYTPVLRFIDLSDPATYEHTVFFELESEIVAKARASANKMQQRIDKFERMAPSLGFLENLKGNDKPEPDFKPDYDDDYSESGTNSILGYDDYESFFANNRGIGIELGFVGFSPELLHKLRLAEGSTQITVDEAEASAQQVVGGMDETGFVSLCHIISHPAFEPVRQECLRTVARLTSLSESLKEILSNEHNVAIVPLTELYDLINTAQTALRLMGVKLVLPKSLVKLQAPKSVMELDSDDEDFKNAKSFLGLDAMLHFNWRVAVGDEPLSADEFKMLLANAGNIVRFRDRFVYADPDLLLSIQHKFERLQDNTTPQSGLLAAMLTGSYEDTPVLISDNVKAKLEEMLKEDNIALPAGLNATLRPYQVRGFEWLMRNARINVGSILADDMGLGKTLQVITTLLKLKQEGMLSKERPALVVVPTSLVTNWQREVANFAPELSLHAYYGLIKDFGFGLSDVIITTYGTARTRLKTLKEHEFSVLVIDEAQAIKTLTTAISKAMREIKADYRIAMSGTPVENRLLEYYSILDFANRGLFGTAKNFHKSFAKPIEEEHDQKAVERFKRLTAPFIMRRLKSDKAIIADLPDKLTSDQYCTLTQQQAAIYQAVVNESLRMIEQYREDSEMRRALVLKLIQQLKAVCNSPAQYDASGKYLPEDSGKVERLFELLQDITEANGKALIFTQSVVMGKILQKLIAERFERQPDFLYGALSRSERMDMVDDFQNDPSNRFLLLSLKAAGTGLNLTAANNVIHFDLWWNPAVENQATDRAYRIGQRNKVQVYRFICANTFEERINAMIQSKRDLAELAVTTGESWLGKLSDRQLNDLFTLHQDKE